MVRLLLAMTAKSAVVVVGSEPLVNNQTLSSIVWGLEIVCEGMVWEPDVVG